jgi:predicted thioesterase
MPLQPGLSARVQLTVSTADTAEAMASGDVPVLATPRLLALCEEATVEAVADRLQPADTTVGRRVKVDHVAAVPVGGSVSAEATLEKVEGRKLVFNVTVTDERGLVAAAKVLRVVVDRQRFLDGVG